MVICELSFTSRDCCSFATFISRSLFWLFIFEFFILGFFLGDRKRAKPRLAYPSDYRDLHSVPRREGGRGSTPLCSNVLILLSYFLCQAKA